MSSSRPPRTASYVVVLTAVVVVASIAVGALSVGANTTDSVYIEKSGTPTTIVPGDSSHTIDRLSINQSGTSFTEDYVRLSVDLTPLAQSNINISSASVDTISIQNGQEQSRDIHESADGNKSLHFVIEYTGAGAPIEVEELVIGSLVTNNIETGSDLQYNIRVNGNHTESIDEPFEDGKDFTSSGSFEIAGGSFRFQEQATGSGTSEGGLTRPSATLENVQANVDSTLIVVFEDNVDRVAGMKNVSSGTLDGNNQISVELDESGGFPGTHSVYLVPESRLSDTGLSSGDEMPQIAYDSVVASESNNSLLGLVEFDDLEHNSGVENNISISSTRLLDGQGGQTPYIITIHPLGNDGNALTDQYIGNSPVLSGLEDSVAVEISVSLKVIDTSQL